MYVLKEHSSAYVSNQRFDSDYELVRLYHPDSVDSRRKQPDSGVRHARFRAITAAYEKLQKDAGLKPSDAEQFEAAQTALRRAYMRRNMKEPTFVDDRWKDRLLVAAISFVSSCFLLSLGRGI